MAKLFLDAGDTFTLSNDATVIGSTGTETVKISGTPNVQLDANIERIELSGATTDYTYQVSGTTITVYSAGVAVATLNGLNQDATVAFSDGSATLALTGIGAATLGGTALPTTAAAVVPATVNATDVSSTSTGTGTTTPVTTSKVLTTATDVITGGAGNDTIIGEFATSPANTANASDQIDGGAGTDTLSLFGTFAAGQMPLSISNVEVLKIASNGAALDLSTYTKAATGIESVVIDDVSAMTGTTITTGTGQSLSLATGNTNKATAGTVTWAGSASDTSLDLTLNGYQGGSGVSGVALTITGALATTQNIASTGAANEVSTLTLGATTNKVVVTGDQALRVNTDIVSSGGTTILKTVDASANTGGTAITLAAATNASFAFTGGTGADSIKLADNGYAALTSGAQLDGGAGTDKLALLDTALTATELAAINAAKNFEVLGLNAAIAAGLDASTVSGFKSFSIDTSAAQTISSLATGSTVDVTVANAAALTLGTAVGVSDVAINIGTASTAGIQGATTLTVSGATAVALASNGTGVGNNSITTLTLLDNSVVTLTGSEALTIGTISNATTTGHKIDASAMTASFVMSNGSSVAYAAGSSTGDVIIGGSAADTLLAGTNSTSLTGNAGNDTFNVEAAVAGGTTNANITTITDFTKGDSIDFAATAGAFTKAAVSLATATTEQAAIDLLVAGNNSDVKWGVYGGNTYIVEDLGAGATLDATDFVVKLTGTLDLSTSSFSGTVLTFA